MISRRGFLRQGALWVAGAVVLEEPIKRLWAFPANPLGSPRVVPLHNDLILVAVPPPYGFHWSDAENYYAAYCKRMEQEVAFRKVWT